VGCVRRRVARSKSHLERPRLRGSRNSNGCALTSSWKSTCPHRPRRSWASAAAQGFTLAGGKRLCRPTHRSGRAPRCRSRGDGASTTPVPIHRRYRRGPTSGEPNAAYDAVLLTGPLYHLVEQSDRLLALREARRVVRPCGCVVAVGISRFASLLDGLGSGWLANPQFRAIAEQDLKTGRHQNPEPDRRPEWFTTAYFHRPGKLAGSRRPVEASQVAIRCRPSWGQRGG